ncbi:C6 transcription factor [Boeremia exigua]|uniref:C6 transcription factor n=1 Tax=Boeremia exigua TaxID=749465 RepID=UPI001E8E89DD|nr:C6 transcription factor [Boeremia exigua]KAH6615143.1 C6 transcription factor [Boeremia exigua]
MAALAPEQAPEVASSPNKRRRIALACSACRTRKSRCDGERPSCSSCLGLGLACQYDPTESATNVVVRRDALSALEQRMAANERTVQRLDRLLNGHLTAVGCTHAGPAEETHSADVLDEQDEDATTNGTAMTFIEERTSAFFGRSSNVNFVRLLLGATAAARKQHSPQTAVEREGTVLESSIMRSSHSAHAPSPVTLSTASMTSLPSYAEMESLLDVYFDTCGVVFPFIHEETMRTTYNECKANGFTRVRRTWLGALNMMFAIASKFDQDGDDSTSSTVRETRSDVFYQRATSLCGELSKQVISLEIVHHLILVVIFCQGTRRSIQAWNVHGLLVRSAVALGLHSSRKQGVDPSAEESRRRTWLVIYGLDKVLSMVFGRPAAILDELPDSANDSADLPGQFLAVSSRLYQIMSSSLTKQYGANVEMDESGLDDLALLKASEDFRRLLRQWTLDLPSHLCLCEPQSEILSQSTQLNRLRVILTLRYHNLCILIERPLFSATIRHLFLTDIDLGGLTAYLVSLSMHEALKCVHAAESTIEIVYYVMIGDASSRNNLGVWFFTLYYVFTASLIISARLLWAKHGRDDVNSSFISRSESLLVKAEHIFQKLNKHSPLVLSCSKYIRHLLELYSQATSTQGTHQDTSPLPTGSQTSNLTSVPSPVELLQLDAEDLEAFGILSSELFDVSMFDSFGLTVPGALPEHTE